MNTKVEERANAPAMPTMGFERDNYGRVKLEGKHIQRKGLTIREHFAGLAMQGLCADSHGVVPETGDKFVLPNDARMIANAAVIMADALIAALNQEQGK